MQYVSDDHDSSTVLSLLHLDRSISHLSHEFGKQVTVDHVVNHVLAHRQFTTPLEIASGKPLESIQQTRDHVRKSITRFVKEPDRWTALASVLLKSLAFHRSLQTLSCTLHNSIEDTPVDLFAKSHRSALDSGQYQLLPIVDLPRTKYNRPYLPHLPLQTTEETVATIKFSDTDDKGTGENENLTARISVSHQYPYVSIVQSSSTLKIGMDLVVFQHQKNECAPTINDFLKLFEASFTSWEWERIQYCRDSNALFGKRRSRTDEAKLREFFLRWSIKEAYTKALGLGMHIDFSSFETRLVGIDSMNNIDTRESIWDTVASKRNTNISSTHRSKLGKEWKDRTSGKHLRSQHQYSLLGEVIYRQRSTKRNSNNEVWEVIFVPLTADDDAIGNEFKIESKYSTHDACACICRGPMLQRMNSLSCGIDDQTLVLIEDIEMLDLINVHGGL